MATAQEGAGKVVLEKGDGSLGTERAGEMLVLNTRVRIVDMSTRSGNQMVREGKESNVEILDN